MDTKYIHLLYVPTMACNMACKYCYLEDNTKELESKYDALETLEYAVNKFKEFFKKPSRVLNLLEILG